MSDYESVPGLDVALDSGVLTLRLSRPDKRNAMDDPMMYALIDAVDRAGRDESVRAILLASEGEHFCAGFDIVARNQEGGKPRVGSIQRRLPAQAHRLIPLLCTTQVPVVCAVRGWAAGIGLNLALAADFTVAAIDARFWAPFVERGFTPDSGATWLLPRRVGEMRAREMILLGCVVHGAEAADWQMIHRAVPAPEVDAVAARARHHPRGRARPSRWVWPSGSSTPARPPRSTTSSATRRSPWSCRRAARTSARASRRSRRSGRRSTGAAEVYERLIVERRGPVGWLVFDRPDVGNALDARMMSELEEAWRELDDDPAVRVIVNTGEGKNFQTGLDVAALSRDKAAMSEQSRRTRDAELRFTAWHNQVWKPVIAAVHGSCAGGGLHFVADADIVIAASDATFFDTHVSLGQAMSYEGVGLSHKMAFEPIMRMALVGRYERMPAAARVAARHGVADRRPT